VAGRHPGLRRLLADRALTSRAGRSGRSRTRTWDLFLRANATGHAGGTTCRGSRLIASAKAHQMPDQSTLEYYKLAAGIIPVLWVGNALQRLDPQPLMSEVLRVREHAVTMREAIVDHQAYFQANEPDISWWNLPPAGFRRVVLPLVEAMNDSLAPGLHHRQRRRLTTYTCFRPASIAANRKPGASPQAESPA